jgi:DNA-directed RNA polymerase specialized sigma24 family protein
MSNSSDDLLTQLNRSVELLVRLKIHEARGEKSQKEMILFLDSLGCSPSEIARFLSIPTTTINPILSRGRQQNNKR